MPPPAPEPEPAEPATHVGAAVCAECHSAETERWRGSHHDRAMEAPEADAVLGAFDGRTLRHSGERYAFVRDGERFRVEIDGAAYDVEWTFGVEPLQQYLVTGRDGRLRADSRE